MATYIELLLQMLSIPSLSREEHERADFIYLWLKNRQHDVKRIGNNILVYEEDRVDDISILLNSHIDTVPPTSGWLTEPFEPQRENGKITGLGSNDAGASLVSLIAAYELLKESSSTSGIALVLSAEEEISGQNGLSMVLEKFSKLKFALVGEPTGMQAAVAERGLMVIDATASGVAGHAARNEGENAIYKAIDDIGTIREIKFEKKSSWLDDPSINVTMINGGIKHNTVPDKCQFVIDVRSNDVYSNKELFSMLEKCCSSELNARSFRLNSSALDQGHLVFELIKEMGLKTYGSPTLSDMALLNVPSLKIGPGESARSHTANEYIFESEIEEAIRIYTELIAGIKDKIV